MKIIKREHDTQADNLKIISREQDIQADRCKNGYSDGCEKERAIAEFKKVTGQDRQLVRASCYSA